MSLTDLDAGQLATEYRKTRTALSKKRKELSGQLQAVKSFSMGHIGSGDAPPTGDMLRDKLNSLQHHFSLLAGIHVDAAKLKHLSKSAVIKLGAALKHLTDKAALRLQDEMPAGKKMTVGVMEATIRVELSEAILAAAEFDAVGEKIAGLHEAVRAVHSHLSQSNDMISQMVRLAIWENPSMREAII